MRHILALDQGTTSSRAIVFDEAGEARGAAQQEFTQYFPRNGWVEHDAEEIWTSQLAVAREAMAKAGISAAEVAAIGITNQRETTIVWERATGRAICPAIVWQDRRTAAFCDGLKERGHAAMVQKKTGLVIDAYFSASKLRWILENVPDARGRAEKAELAFGTVDSWLLFKLSGGKVHATDVSNASRTMLFNINTLRWDEELLGLFGVPAGMLPQVRDSSGDFGASAAEILGGAIAIRGMAGDQQAALFGQGCFMPGYAKNTYGTGCFLLINSGDKPAISTHKLLSTVAWRIGAQTKYALEGSVFIGGAVVQWLRDGLGLIKTAAEIEPLAASVPDSGGVYLVPAFAGLGAPHWDPYARGTIMGITRSTTAGHLARAAVESIAFQVADILEVMQADSGTAIKALRVDGGAAANNELLQFQADLLRVPVIRPKVTESTALGAAYLAGLAAGIFESQEQLATLAKVDRVFEPVLGAAEAEHRRKRWREAMKRSRDWAERECT